MFSKKGIGIGVDDFKKIIESNYYFVNKSSFIEEIIGDGAQVKLFCRPRRFGKTLNMSMLKYFFDVREKEENRSLFNGLYIESSPMMREQGKYPVIFITLKEFKENSWEEFLSNMSLFIFKMFKEFQGLEEICISQGEKTILNNLQNRKGDISELKYSLQFLTELLSKKYSKKVILLIDEYDTPLLTANEFGYYQEAVQFFKTFYGGALKSNVHLQLGVLTGIIRVAQAGIFSDLNNFVNDPIISTKKYQNYFGLLETEVEEALKYYEIDYKLDEVKSWYNGYTFGRVQVYNPWSILNFLRDRELKAYWVNTSSNYLIREILKNSDREVVENLNKIFNGEEIITSVDSNIEVHSNLAENEIYSLMLFFGYLTLGEKITTDIYSVRVPNKEIMTFFHKAFIEMIFNRVTDIDNVKVALITKNMKLFEKSIQKLIIENISFNDLTQKENSYQ